jgi:hypothetical protein
MGVALSLLLLSVACVSTSPEIYLGDATCVIPCWYGLTPGKTTFEEAQTVIQSLPFVATDSIEIGPPHFGPNSPPSQSVYIYWQFTGGAVGQGVIFFGEEERIQEIRLDTRGVTLGPVIDSFEAPEIIWASITPMIDNFDSGPHYNLSLYFPKGVFVEVSDRTKGDLTGVTQDVTRELNVSSIHLFAPTDLETFLTEVTNSPYKPSNMDYIRERLQPWPGFGKDVIHVSWP